MCSLDLARNLKRGILHTRISNAHKRLLQNTHFEPLTESLLFNQKKSSLSHLSFQGSEEAVLGDEGADGFANLSLEFSAWLSLGEMVLATSTKEMAQVRLPL